jgi:hypothetical protein
MIIPAFLLMGTANANDGRVINLGAPTIIGQGVASKHDGFTLVGEDRQLGATEFSAVGGCEPSADQPIAVTNTAKCPPKKSGADLLAAIRNKYGSKFNGRSVGDTKTAWKFQLPGHSAEPVAQLDASGNLQITSYDERTNEFMIFELNERGEVVKKSDVQPSASEAESAAISLAVDSSAGETSSQGHVADIQGSSQASTSAIEPSETVAHVQQKEPRKASDHPYFAEYLGKLSRGEETNLNPTYNDVESSYWKTDIVGQKFASNHPAWDVFRADLVNGNLKDVDTTKPIPYERVEAYAQEIQQRREDAINLANAWDNRPNQQATGEPFRIANTVGSAPETRTPASEPSPVFNYSIPYGFSR